MENENIEIIENKKKNSKRPYVIAILMALLLVITITATSYAYFTANVSGTGQNNVVTTTSLEIEFTDGPQVALENAVPGQYIEKTFKVENKGSGDTPYDIYMSEVINDFVDKTDLVYTLTSSDGGHNVSSQTQVPSTNSKIIDTHLLRAGQTHNYVLRITFKETNDNQDDNKGKQFSTIIRVNEVKEIQTSTGDYIKELVSNADPTSTDEIGTTGLAYDVTEDNNLRYIGANPNNYVSFNNELWRIIGVMNNIETESGETKSLLKIIRSESLGEYSWDTSTSGVNDRTGVNEWSQADLMQELNNDYLGNVTIGTDGNWYSGQNNAKANAKPSTTISNAAQNQIESVKWNLGSPSNNAGSYDSYLNSVTSSTTYTRERSNYTGKICTSETLCNDTVTRTSSWTGKVGLMYPSDYLYATSGGNATNRQTCLGLGMYTSWSKTSYANCKDNDWLKPASGSTLTLSPYAHSSYAIHVFAVDSTGAFGNSHASDARGADGVHPVVFLKSSVKILSGTGTQTDPYTIG